MTSFLKIATLELLAVIVKIIPFICRSDLDFTIGEFPKTPGGFLDFLCFQNLNFGFLTMT